MKYLRQSVTGMCASWWILSIAVVPCLLQFAALRGDVLRVSDRWRWVRLVVLASAKG